MPLVQTTLEQDLKNAFSEMKKGGANTNDAYFAQKLAEACKKFGESGTITTVDAGAVPAGAFTGTGTGSLSLQSSLMEQPLLSACKAMTDASSGDSILANGIGNALFAMVSAGKVDTNITGTVVSPSGVPSPLAGTGTGTITCSQSSLISGLVSCFSEMKDKGGEEGYDGDSVFAEKMASLVNSFFKQGIVTVSGTGVLAGSVGSGTMA